jgi:small subunit ribosomal protein S21
MKYRKNFRKKRKPKDTSVGLSVTVFNNNVEGALKVLKKKVKNSGLMQDLRKKEYYVKPSETKRHKKNLAKLRNKYNMRRISWVIF